MGSVPVGMKDKIAEAKRIYFSKEFGQNWREIQGLTDGDIKAPVPALKSRIMRSEEGSPLALFDAVLEELSAKWTASASCPVNADWHHFVVPGVLIAALRNVGYDFSDRDVDEAMARGERFGGGSCGFAGTCGGAYGAGIVASIVNKTTPLHDEERSENMVFVAKVLEEIARYPRRCCKRSSYIAMERVTDYLREKGYDKISFVRPVCRWSSMNEMCLGEKCPYNENFADSER
jgi:hypothetical protein